MDSNFMDAAKEEKARKEKLQCRHYFMLNELQNMSRDLKGYVSIFRNAPFNATLGHPPDLELRIEEETKRMDQRLILELDQRVSEQQVTLERAGVAGFYVTNNQQEVRLQMHMLDMIVRLSKVELPDL
uniref:Protein DGCR6-like n=1 Tax=Saccoglossus kowalevskii TaxID=10224 RepID=A0ABM0MQS8_SACKO|nr:PREDICTED: protein DGCR6-like [Saccoglossus kowalevskii]